MIGDVFSTSHHEVRTMHRQALIAWLMILLQAAMFWYMSETIVFPILVAVISSPALWWRHRWQISSASLPWIDLAVAIVCALQWNLAPYEPPTMTTVLNYPLVHAAGQFFLLVQVARLWASRSDRPMPIYLPLLAVIVFICLGDVQLSKTGRMRRMHQRATLALVGLSCAYYSMARRRQESQSTSVRWVRPTASVAILAICVVSTRAGNEWLLEKWSDIENFLRGSETRPAAGRQNVLIGFSGQAPLGSIQFLRSSLDEQIAMRVISDRAPGYLRGAVFERYTLRGWESHSDWIPISRSRKAVPTPNRSAAAIHAPSTAQSVFLLRENFASNLRPVTIWRAPSMDQFTFLPLTTSQLEAPIDILNFDRHSVVSTDNMPPEAKLTAWVPDPSGLNPFEPIVQPMLWETGTPLNLDRQVTMTAKLRLQQVPEQLTTNPNLLQLATKVFEGCKSPSEKLTAIQNYFAKWHYSTSVEIPPMIDPMLYFLLEKPAANCEFFASGTAILLRIAGIPCRYVTGFSGGEYNLLGKYWVVRQRDAHAWVEAYVPNEGWVIVDSTPADHIPKAVTKFGLWQLWDELTLRGQIIRTALAAEGWSSKWRALKLALLSFLNTIPGALMTGGLLFLAVRKLRFARRKTNSRPLEPTVIELRRLLDELDHRLRRLKLERAAHETLHQFAARLHQAASSHSILSEAAEWYLHYADTRYGRLMHPEILKALRIELQAVCARLSERPTSL